MKRFLTGAAPCVRLSPSLQWCSPMPHAACATWRTSWRTGLRAPGWRGLPWACCWRLWANRRRTSRRCRAFWKQRWRSNEILIYTHMHMHTLSPVHHCLTPQCLVNRLGPKSSSDSRGAHSAQHSSPVMRACACACACVCVCVCVQYVCTVCVTCLYVYMHMCVHVCGNEVNEHVCYMYVCMPDLCSCVLRSFFWMYSCGLVCMFEWQGCYLNGFRVLRVYCSPRTCRGPPSPEEHCLHISDCCITLLASRMVFI